MRPALLLAALLLAPSAAAQVSSGEDGTKTLQPGQIYHPPPTPLARGEALAYQWQVTAPVGGQLYFSTHIHLGAQLVNLTEETSNGRTGKLVADREGLYSLLWEDRGNESVTYTYSFHPERGAPASTPWPAALAVLALAAAALGRRP